MTTSASSGVAAASTVETSASSDTGFAPIAEGLRLSAGSVAAECVITATATILSVATHLIVSQIGWIVESTPTRIESVPTANLIRSIKGLPTSRQLTRTGEAWFTAAG